MRLPVSVSASPSFLPPAAAAATTSHAAQTLLTRPPTHTPPAVAGSTGPLRPHTHTPRPHTCQQLLCHRLPICVVHLRCYLCATPALLLSLRLQELAGELGGHLAKNAVSVEQSLRVVYMPQAVFRVRPVARCTASMAGHSESVLVVAFSPDGRRLATGSGDTTLRFWDLNTQLPQFECKVRRMSAARGLCFRAQPTAANSRSVGGASPPAPLCCGRRPALPLQKRLSMLLRLVHVLCVGVGAVGPQELGAVCGMVP